MLIDEKTKKRICENVDKMRGVEKTKIFMSKFILGVSIFLPIFTSAMMSLTTKAAVSILLGASAFTIAVGLLAGGLLQLLNLHGANNSMKDLTGGKLSYKQYKQLVKSGELDKILNEAKIVEVYDYHATKNPEVKNNVTHIDKSKTHDINLKDNERDL